MENVERRYYPLAEIRIEGDSEPRLRGHAIVFGQDSVDLGGFIERVAPESLTRTLGSGENIHAFWNHDTGLVLGSTRGGKLALAAGASGLEFDLSAKRLTEAQADAVRDGDMQMSFGFRTRKDSWEIRDGQPDIRTLLDIDLFEISLVSRPAYPQTDVALRSLTEWRATTEEARPTNIEPVPDHNLLRAKIRLALL